MANTAVVVVPPAAAVADAPPVTVQLPEHGRFKPLARFFISMRLSMRRHYEKNAVLPPSPEAAALALEEGLSKGYFLIDGIEVCFQPHYIPRFVDALPNVLGLFAKMIAMS